MTDCREWGMDAAKQDLSLTAVRLTIEEKKSREFFYETIVRQTESHFCVLRASDLATLSQLLTAAL